MVVLNLGVLSSQVSLQFDILSDILCLPFLLNKGCDPSKVSETGKLAVQLTIAVFASTVHSQDFKDVGGDRLTGRRTVPIMFPVASRLVVAVGIPTWSYLLCCIWDIDWSCTLAFVAYGCFVGGRFLCLRTHEADKQSCKYYSVRARCLYCGCLVGYTDFASYRSGSRSITYYPDTGIISTIAASSESESCSSKPGTFFRVRHDDEDGNLRRQDALRCGNP